METKKNLLVTLADRNYIQQAKQLFSSVYWNAGWKGDYMLLSHNIPEKELKWFRDKGILIKKCQPLSDKGWGRFSPLILDKFYLFTPEFRKWEHILYLDTDIIVRADINGLLRAEKFEAVRDFTYARIKNRFEKKISGLSPYDLEYLRCNYHLNSLSFNAGVFVFPTNLIKKETFGRLIHLFEKYVNYCEYGEQTILNIYFQDWRKLPIVYNIWADKIGSLFGMKKNRIKGIILHFPGCWKNKNRKPWAESNPFYREWKKNLERADIIKNFNHSSSEKKDRWSLYKIFSYSSYIFFGSLYIKIIGEMNNFLGDTGKNMKKHMPRLYWFLKKIINPQS